MVKIPEMPGGYKPGDVVNGHVLTDRGHWVKVSEAAAWGTRPGAAPGANVGSTVPLPPSSSSSMNVPGTQVPVSYGTTAPGSGAPHTSTPGAGGPTPTPPRPPVRTAAPNKYSPTGASQRGVGSGPRKSSPLRRIIFLIVAAILATRFFNSCAGGFEDLGSAPGDGTVVVPVDTDWDPDLGELWIDDDGQVHGSHESRNARDVLREG